MNSKNIRKHKNDIFRLLLNVVPSGKIETPEEIRKDIIEFAEMIVNDKPDLKNFGIRGTDLEELLELLRNIFLEKSEA
ncbi:hypothetical protein [Anoxynatronum sibiricum]|uniref:Uncharacterized protein n=1 Tax=Anoxynatronum sibiricum TaxID=210623 RepID=A0ABU9VQF3_9CLOT